MQVNEYTWKFKIEFTGKRFKILPSYGDSVKTAKDAIVEYLKQTNQYNEVITIKEV